MIKSKTLCLAILLAFLVSTNSSAATTASNVHRMSVSASGTKMPMGSDGMMTGSMNGLATGAFVMNKSCMKVAPKILTDMSAHPSRYSLMVHTKSYPDGAVMGTLK